MCGCVCGCVCGGCGSVCVLVLATYYKNTFFTCKVRKFSESKDNLTVPHNLKASLRTEPIKFFGGGGLKQEVLRVGLELGLC